MVSKSGEAKVAPVLKAEVRDLAIGAVTIVRTASRCGYLPSAGV